MDIKKFWLIAGLIIGFTIGFMFGIASEIGWGWYSDWKWEKYQNQFR